MKIINYSYLAIFLTTSQFVLADEGLIERKLPVCDYSKLTINVPSTIKLVALGSPSGSVKGANKELDYLRFKCLDGSLEISTKDNVLVNEYFKFELVNGSLNHLILNGDQKVDVTELSAKHFEITVNGIGKVSLTGQVAFFNASLNGLAELDAANLKSEDGRVEVNGAGIAKLNVSSELNARVNGSGSVEYLGTPVNLKTEVNGSGSITSVP
ncbi:GIN domain-containing protein [Vibrio cholerae]|uniref:GIN domain-containing protein n=1 Tax=Vibrio cholerae TaxID=666 RepID=UPI002D7A2231|nr:DUF2807 domain-containing protein [Vibrio cholerae]